MPRKRRRLKEKKLQTQALYAQLREAIRSGEPWIKDTRYNNSHVADLVRGNFYFEDSWEDEKAKQEAWEELKSGILEQHIQHRPGTRPAAWWDYETVDGKKPLRRMVSGRAPQIIAKTSFGIPSCTAGSYPDQPACYESELEHLERNQLLFKEEIPLIEADAEGEHDNYVSYWE